MKLLLPLLLVGCATSTYELEEQLFACDNDHAIGCDLIREELQERYDLKDRRRNQLECSPGATCYTAEQWERATSLGGR